MGDSPFAVLEVFPSIREGAEVFGRAALFGFLKFALILAGGAAGGIGLYKFSGESPSVEGSNLPSSNSRADGASPVHALGSIQPRDGVVELALPPGTRPSRFDDKIAQDGPVTKGQVIAYLDGYEARMQEVAVIEAEIAAAREAIRLEDENEKITLAEIDRERDQAIELGGMEQASLKLKIAALNDKFALAQKQLKAVEGLQLNNTIPLEKYDQVFTQCSISRDELAYARAEADRVLSVLRLGTAGPKVEQQKEKARLLAERAKGQVALDTLVKKLALGVQMAEQAKVRSPIDGVVLDICTKAGESSAGKPLVKLGDTEKMYVQAEIYEDDSRLVRPGQKVEITGRGLPGKPGEPIRGVVEKISSIIGAHKQSLLDPTSRDNGRVFPAWIALDLEAGDDSRKAELAGLRKLVLLPVDVSIFVDDEKKGGGRDGPDGR